MSGIYDWEDDFESEEEYLAYLEWLHSGEVEPVFNPLTGLFPIVERIREYVGDDYRDHYTRDVADEIEAVQSYIEHGFEDLEAYLARHNEFYTYLQEREQREAA